jgi:hypothetical protein
VSVRVPFPRSPIGLRMEAALLWGGLLCAVRKELIVPQHHPSRAATVECAGNPGPARALIVPNVFEYNRRGLAPGLPAIVQAPWRAVGRAFAEVALFWGTADDRLMLAPHSVAPEFVAYVRERLGLRHLAVLAPRDDTGDLARDTLSDPDLLATLVAYARVCPAPALVTWGTTPGLYPLVAALARQGAGLATPDLPPRAAYWVGQHYDSKAGFRALCAELGVQQPGLRLPEGYVCHSLDHALDCAAHFQRRGRGCVLKANLGSSGAGTILLGREWRLRPATAMRDYLGAHVGMSLPLFATGPVIVEELVGPAVRGTGGGASPTFFLNAVIDEVGAVTISGGGREVRDDENGYTGAYLGRGALPGPLAAEVAPLLTALGEMLAARGYHGHLGVDFVVDGAGRPVLLELNPRRGAASYVQDVGTRLYGPGWAATHHAVSRLPLAVELARSPGVGMLLDTFEAANRRLEPGGCLVLPVCLSWLRLPDPALGYVAFGPDARAVARAERVLHAALRARGVQPLL